MKPKTLTLAVSGLLLAILAGLAAFYAYSEREAKADLDGLARQRAALESGIHRAESRLAAATRASSALQSAQPAPPKANAVKTTFRITSQLNFRVLLNLLTTDPKLFKLAMKVYRSGVAMQFGPLFRALNMTPEQIDKFETLAVQHQQAVVDILASAAQEGIPFDDPAVTASLKPENDQFTSAEQALVGDAGAPELQQFLREQPLSGVVHQVAETVALTSTPLVASQADQLLQIMASSSSQYQSGGTATYGSINWPAALGQAQAILSPAQYAALQGMYLQNQISQLRVQFTKQEQGTP